MYATSDRLSPEERRRVYRRTGRILAPQRQRLVLAASFVVIQAGATLAGPAIVRYGIDEGVVPRDVSTS